MQFPPTVAVVLTGAALAAAFPVDDAIPGGVFTIAQEKNQHFKESTGLDALLHAFSKYNATLTPRLRAAVEVNTRVRTKLQQRGTMLGSVAASPPIPFDIEYISPIKIGTPPQIINVAIDTGSADLWVMSTDTPVDQQNGRPVYSPLKSSTSRLIPNATWAIRYGDGSGASGIAYTDQVQLGGARFDTQVVESARYVSQSFTEDVWISGLMGLGMSWANTVRPERALTFTDNIRDKLARPVFTANLRAGRPGNYNFGFINPREYNGAIGWAPAIPFRPWWEVRVDGFRVGSGPYWARPFTGIVDTGTTLLLLPEWMGRHYYAQVAGAEIDRYWGSWVFPCASALPDFKFVIGGVVGVVPGRYMRYWQYDDRMCYGGLQSSAGLGINVFGDVLLKAQFVIFDMRQMRVGLANKKLLS